MQKPKNYYSIAEYNRIEKKLSPICKYLSDYVVMYNKIKLILFHVSYLITNIINHNIQENYNSVNIFPHFTSIMSISVSTGVARVASATPNVSNFFKNFTRQYILSVKGSMYSLLKKL